MREREVEGRWWEGDKKEKNKGVSGKGIERGSGGEEVNGGGGVGKE